MNYNKQLKSFASVLINFARQEAKIQYLKQSLIVLLLTVVAEVACIAAAKEAQTTALHKLVNNQI